MSNFDILNIGASEIPPLDGKTMALLERGRKERTQVLDGVSAERFKGRTPYAVTRVRIVFDNEDDLINCVRLLRWSDERLAAMGSVINWNWEVTARTGMMIEFSVAWHDRDFFAARKAAFADDEHRSYFRMFGKNLEEMKIETEVLRK